MSGVLTLLLVVMGLALLYAYRSQTPAVQTISVDQAIAEIQAGRVARITIRGDTATLAYREREPARQTVLPSPPQTFQKVLDDYNTANPARQITIEYQPESATLSVIASIFLSLLPVLLIGGFFYFLMRRALPR